MKKLVCMLLTLALMMSCSIVAFADSDSAHVYDIDSEPTTIEVKGKIEEGYTNITAQKNYVIEIQWSVIPGAAATLDTMGSYTWNTTDLKYELIGDINKHLVIGGQAADVEIKLTNKSNADVAYVIAWANSDSAPTALTISESAMGGSVKSGRLTRADAAFDEEGIVTSGYDINKEMLDENSTLTGTATTGEYDGAVTFRSYDEDSLTTGEFTLGTYTITLSENTLS